LRRRHHQQNSSSSAQKAAPDCSELLGRLRNRLYVGFPKYLHIPAAVLGGKAIALPIAECVRRGVFESGTFFYFARPGFI
jgi:hypothetical protein